MSIEKIQPLASQERRSRPEPRFNSVVLIDDNDVDLYVNETIIKVISLSKEVKKEPNPSNFINQLNDAERLSEVPELVFLDLNMKGMNGFEFLEEFSHLSDFVRNKCKIIIVTSSESSADKNHALMNSSVIRYFIKPLDVYQLKDFMYS